MSDLFYYFVSLLVISLFTLISFQKNIFLFSVILGFIWTIFQIIANMSPDFNISILAILSIFFYTSIIALISIFITKGRISLISYWFFFLIIFGGLAYLSKIYVFPILFKL